MAIKLLDQRDHVDRARRLGQIDHARIDAAVGVEREVFGPEMFGRLVVGEVVEEDRAQDGAFGFYVCGKTADCVIGGCHGFCNGTLSHLPVQHKRM